MRPRAFHILVLGLLGLAACFDPEDGDQPTGCTGDGSCKGDRVCIDRSCVLLEGSSSEGEPASETEETPGDQCVDVGMSCEINGDCCEFGSSSAGCVGFPSGNACADRCSEGDECVSGCCVPLLIDGDPQPYGACAASELCVPTPCGGASCTFDWCATIENDCPVSYFGDGSCDCGCQFADVDCA